LSHPGYEIAVSSPSWAELGYDFIGLEHLVTLISA
jgi:hypothetical protein